MTKDVDLSDFKLVDGVHERGPSFAASQLFNGCGRMFALTATYLPARPKCRTVRVARAHSNGSPQRQSTRTMRGRLLRCMSPPGVQGEGHHFENLLHLLRNFERLTTCRHDMPYVVAYVVPDVVVSGV